MEYLFVFATVLVALVQSQSIINGPKNTAGMLGERVELPCEAVIANDILEWRYFPQGSSTGIRIWQSGGEVKDSQFRVEVEGNVHKLIIVSLSTELATLYSCKLIVKDVGGTAEVTALENFHCLPSWAPPPMPPDPKIVVEGAEMDFTCSVSHTGNIKPKLEWYQDGNPIQTHVSDDGDTITAVANVTATAELDEVPFECRLAFDYIQGGSYPPEYTDQCSTYYQVEHAATNILTSPAPEYEGQVISVEIGSFINCTASGRPEPAIFWYDKDTFETREEWRLEITPDLAGEHTWVCKAENIVMGNPRFAEYEVTFKAEGYATDSPYVPPPAAGASTQPWVIAVAVIIPILIIALVLFLGFYCVKKRRGKSAKSEKDGVPADAQDPVSNEPLMHPVAKPRPPPSVSSQDSGVATPTHGGMYPAGSQGRIYKPRSQGQMNRQPSQDPQMYAPQMYRPPSQGRLDNGSNLQMVRRGSQDNLDQSPNPQMYRAPSQDRLAQAPNPRMYRAPSQDSTGPQPAPRTKLSKSRENLAMQPELKPRPRGSVDQPLSGYGLMGDDAAMKKSRENLANVMHPDGRPKTLPKPKSREDLSSSMDEGQRSGPPTLPKPSMQQKLGIQVLPPPPQRHKSVDTEV